MGFFSDDGRGNRFCQQFAVTVLNVDPVGPNMSLTDEGWRKDGSRSARKIVGGRVIGENIKVEEGWGL